MANLRDIFIICMVAIIATVVSYIITGLIFSANENYNAQDVEKGCCENPRAEFAPSGGNCTYYKQYARCEYYEVNPNG